MTKTENSDLTFLRGQMELLVTGMFNFDNCRSYCSDCLLCYRKEEDDEPIYFCESADKMMGFFRMILSNELTQSLCVEETRKES